MEAVYYLLPLALFLRFGGLAALIWSLKSGQMDDLEGPAHRILFDDDQDLIPGGDGRNKEKKDDDDNAPRT